MKIKRDDCIKMLLKDSLGYRLKLLRISKKITTREVAEKLGVSSSYISMVENGKSKVTLKVLSNLLPIYGESVTEFLEAPKSAGRVRHLKDMIPLAPNMPEMDVRVLRAASDSDVIRPFYFSLEPGASTEIMRYEGVEFVIVIEGKVSYSLTNPNNGEEEQYVLEKWDFMHYPSSLYHMCTNIGDTPCIFMIILS